MEQEPKSVSGLPISGALVIVALILGAITFQQLPYTPSRPKNVKTIENAQSKTNVRARLSQDPFGAVMRDKYCLENKNDKNTEDNKKKNDESLDDAWCLDLAPYEWLEPENSSREKILVLWLSDNSFYGSSLNKLSQLKKAIIKKPGLKFNVLGPAGSTNLKYMVKEVKTGVPTETEGTR